VSDDIQDEGSLNYCELFEQEIREQKSFSNSVLSEKQKERNLKCYEILEKRNERNTNCYPKIDDPSSPSR